MMSQKVCIARQINERLYQFLVPVEAPHWKEVLMIIDDIRSEVAAKQAEAEKQAEEAAKKQE